jgi:hypothetical protein
VKKEEIVRQALIEQMVKVGGYPKSLIAVEKSLAELPHLKGLKGIPKRRADILVFAPDSLTPLILIECKAVPLKEDVIRQVIGYNHFVKAPWIVIVNQEEIQTARYQEEGWVFFSGFLSFNEALQHVIKDIP